MCCHGNITKLSIKASLLRNDHFISILLYRTQLIRKNQTQESHVCRKVSFKQSSLSNVDVFSQVRWIFQRIHQGNIMSLWFVCLGKMIALYLEFKCDAVIWYFLDSLVGLCHQNMASCHGIVFTSIEPVQWCSQTHSRGWARVPLPSFFLTFIFFLNFPSNIPHFFPHFGSSDGSVREGLGYTTA